MKKPTLDHIGIAVKSLDASKIYAALGLTVDHVETVTTQGVRTAFLAAGDANLELLEPIGMFHAYFNSISGTFGTLAPIGVFNVEQRRPALVLLMSTGSEAEFPSCLASLGQFGAQLLKTGTLTSGSYTLHVWLIRLGRYSR